MSNPLFVRCQACKLVLHGTMEEMEIQYKKHECSNEEAGCGIEYFEMEGTTLHT